ncbi:MAG: hypothetical protein IRY90_13970 [Actinomadura rubrobrunea]|nr:hypothetical protein [Actinomadura rubrobrunea]
MSLSAAALLAAGAPPALAADVPEFQVDVTASPKEVAEAGDFITLSVTVTAKNPEAEEIKQVAVKTTTESSDSQNTIVDPVCEPSPCTIDVGTDDAPKPTDLARVTAQKSITAKVLSLIHN